VSKKKLTLELTEEQHKALKVLAASKGVSIKSLVVEALGL